MDRNKISDRDRLSRKEIAMYKITSPDFGTYVLCTSCVENERPKFANAEFLSVVELKDAEHMLCDKSQHAQLSY